MTGPLLDVRNLRVRFDRGRDSIDVLRGVSFDVHAGETVALVGESGSGKSVTTRAILRLLERNASLPSGSISFDGRDLLALSERQLRDLRGGEISLILQDAMTALNPSHTIGAQVAESLRLHRDYSRRTAAAHAVELLDRVGISEPGQVARQYPHQLSGGMRQRAVIAGALACRPKLLIADEPTTALVVTIQAQVLALLADLIRENDTALLLITHDFGVVADVADRVVVMYAGEIVEKGAVEEILEAPRHPYTIGLLDSIPSRAVPGQPLPAIAGQIPHPDQIPSGCVFHPRCAYAIDSCRSDHPLLAAVDGGTREVACPVPIPTLRPVLRLVDVTAVAAEPTPMLTVSGLSKVFRSRNVLGLAGSHDVAAVADVSFMIGTGRTLGLVGESGSGKSTTARLVARLIDATSGSIELDGRDLSSVSGEELRQRRRDVQVVFQDSLGSLDPRRRIASSIAEPLRAFEQKVTRARVTELLDMVGLSSRYADRSPHELSGGQRQRVALARALALRPKLLICDEPVASLDVSIQAQVVNLLQSLQQELGLTYLFISHDLSLIRHLSSDIAVMLKGRIVEHGAAEDVYTNPQHAYTQRLVAAVPGERRFRRLEDVPAVVGR